MRSARTLSICSSALRSAPGRRALATMPCSSRRDLAESDQLGGAEHAQVAPAQQRADRLRRGRWICSEKPTLACASADLICWRDQRLLAARCRCRSPPLRPGSVAEASRAAMFGGITTAARALPDLHLLRRACARVGAPLGIDPREQLVGEIADRHALCRRPRRSAPGGVSSTTPTCGRDGDARDREADQQRDRDRVEHQHARPAAASAPGSAGPYAAASSLRLYRAALEEARRSPCSRSLSSLPTRREQLRGGAGEGEPAVVEHEQAVGVPLRLGGRCGSRRSPRCRRR